MTVLDPWTRLLNGAAEFPIDTADAAVLAFAPDPARALQSLRDVRAGRRTMASVLNEYRITKSEAQNRGKVLVYLSKDLGLLSDLGNGLYEATTVGATLPTAAGATVARRRAPAPPRRLRRGSDVADRARPGRGRIRVVIDLDVAAERTVEHQRIVRAAVVEYLARRCEVYEANYDVLAICGNDAFLVEAKTITAFSERAQLKLAVGQLFTYEVDDAAPLIGRRRVTKVVATNGAISQRGRTVLDALAIQHRSY